MTLQETITFIQAASWLGCRPGLERIADLMHRLGDPQKELRFVHITGTNGKGSTAAMLSAILREAGYTVGLFTSPHLRFYHERIQINGTDISDEELCAAAETVKLAVEQMDTVPSEFERFTAMALTHFRQRRCDIVVLEVGLGGRLDSTNVIPAPEVAVITNIGLEHTEYLGDTVEKIAAEKAGIIKPGADVVLSGQCPEAEAAIRDKASACGSVLCVTDTGQLRQISADLTGQRLDYRERKNLHLRLLGTYQCHNAAAALDTVDALRRRGWDIPEAAVRRGLKTVTWPGRFEVLRTKPLVLADGAHNPSGVAELARCLEQYLPGRKCLFLTGVMADKDYASMMRIIVPYAASFITVTPPSERALSAQALKAQIGQCFSGPIYAVDSVEAGLELALASLEREQPLCIFGSLYQLGAVREFFGK